MGLYFDSNETSFREEVKQTDFVDKSLLIEETNKAIEKRKKFICVSRPRRFGKTFNAEMLLAYYSCGDKTRNLFKNLKIAQSDSFLRHLNQYHVLFLNPMNFCTIRTKEKSLTDWVKVYAVKEMKEAFPDLEVPSERFSDYIIAIYKKTKKKFVIIIDEYDYIFREYPNDTKEQEEYLNFLNELFKSSDTQKYIALAYLTGIMPLKTGNGEAKLNYFQNMSAVKGMDFFDHFGFSEDEVKKLCKKFHSDPSKMKHWYSGYRSGKEGDIYNTLSVLYALDDECFKDYWTLTSSSEVVDILVDSSFEGISDDIVELICGGQVRIHPSDFNYSFDGFKSKDELFTTYVHLGYLTYIPDERDAASGWVRIPNYEILLALRGGIKGKPLYSYASDYIDKSWDLFQETLEGNAKYVEEALDKAHEKYSSILTYNDENSLSCILRLAYNYAEQDYTIIRELPSGKGFVDFAFLPVDSKNPALVIELKKDKDAKTAIDQIKDKHYPKALEHYKNNLLLVGINYDSKSKKHTCIIEKA